MLHGDNFAGSGCAGGAPPPVAGTWATGVVASAAANIAAISLRPAWAGALDARQGLRFTAFGTWMLWC